MSVFLDKAFDLGPTYAFDK